MSDLKTKMKQLDQRLLRIKQQKAKLKEQQRKKDTRLKIELGGLVFTSDIHTLLPDLEDRDGEARAIILGVLADASSKLSSSEYRTTMLNRGRHIFTAKARSKRRAEKAEGGKL